MRDAHVVRASRSRRAWYIDCSIGGEIGFDSVAGGGSTFWIDLPLHGEPAVRDSRPPNLPLHDVAPLDARPRTVLYIEDSQANLALMRDLFRELEGATLITRTSAEDGLTAACALSPDAILMDINLPRMSGLEALAALRGDARTRDIPVIALTAAASARDVRAGLRAGFVRYLAKPIRLDALTDALEAAYRQQLAASERPRVARGQLARDR